MRWGEDRVYRAVPKTATTIRDETSELGRTMKLPPPGANLQITTALRPARAGKNGSGRGRVGLPQGCQQFLRVGWLAFGILARKNNLALPVNDESGLGAHAGRIAGRSEDAVLLGHRAMRPVIAAQEALERADGFFPGHGVEHRIDADGDQLHSGRGNGLAHPSDGTHKLL